MRSVHERISAWRGGLPITAHSSNFSSIIQPSRAANWNWRDWKRNITRRNNRRAYFVVNVGRAICEVKKFNEFRCFGAARTGYSSKRAKCFCETPRIFPVGLFNLLIKNPEILDKLSLSVDGLVGVILVSWILRVVRLARSIILWINWRHCRHNERDCIRVCDYSVIRPLDELSRRTAKHNGTSWRSNGAT